MKRQMFLCILLSIGVTKCSQFEHERVVLALSDEEIVTTSRRITNSLKRVLSLYHKRRKPFLTEKQFAEENRVYKLRHNQNSRILSSSEQAALVNRLSKSKNDKHTRR